MFSHVLVASINFPFRRLRKSMGYWPSGYWASLLTDQCQIQLLYPQTRFRGSYWLPMIFGRDRQVKIFWLPLNAFTQVLDIAWGHLSGKLIENRSENLEYIDDVVVLVWAYVISFVCDFGSCPWRQDSRPGVQYSVGSFETIDIGRQHLPNDSIAKLRHPC